MADVRTNPQLVALWDDSALTMVGTISNPLIVKQYRASTPTETIVAGIATSTIILAANSARIRATVSNNSTSILYILEGTGTASSTNYTYKLFTDDTLILDDYTGQLSGIWVTATGQAQVTEVV